MKRRRSQSGFTLLELVLVMLIALTALAIAAPNMRGWRQGTELRNSADQFLMVTRAARSRAVTEAAIFRIAVNANAGQYQLLKQEGLEYVPASPGSLPPQVYHVPEGGRMELTKHSFVPTLLEPEVQECIDFYPTGRTQHATVRISDRDGYEVEIANASAADDFRVTYIGVIR